MIQLKYIKHFYGKNNNKKKTINDMKYYISKERLIDVYKNIPIIQKKTKKYLSHKNRFDVNKVDNKPLIDICYIKKQYISNAFEALLRVQQKIKSREIFPLCFFFFLIFYTVADITSANSFSASSTFTY